MAVLTVSDGVAAGRREDTSGRLAREWVERNGWTLTGHAVVPDESGAIAAALCGWSDGDSADLILTLGGTGFGPRDVTPEATAPILQRLAPGIPETLRAAGRGQTPHAVLSRGLAGIRGRALIVNLPGSSRAVAQGLEILAGLVPHAIELLAGRTDHA